MRVIREPKLKVTGPIVTATEVNSLQPPEYAESDVWGEIRTTLATDDRVLVMIDDDATGCQTVHGVSLCLDYSEETLTDAFSKRPRALFIVSNSRSLNQQEMAERISEITRRVQNVCSALNVDFVMVSRSDSTLRGHYPIETDVMKQHLFGTVESTTDVLIPAFFEGARVTVFDSQWIIQDGNCIPVGQTEFAKDPLFGYRYSHLPHYIKDKFAGYAEVPNIAAIEVEDLRRKGPTYVKDVLLGCERNSIVIVNALTYRDMEVFVLGALWAEQDGFVPMYRSGASFVRVRAGIEQAPYLAETPHQPPLSAEHHGGLVLVGSYTQLATQQLDELLSGGEYVGMELSVSNIISGTAEPPDVIAARISDYIEDGANVVCYTSRREKRVADRDDQWDLGRQVAAYIAAIVDALKVTPRFFVAKGGLTAYEVAVHGLHVKMCRVVGQVFPGVPQWEVEVGSHTIPYVVFPGNVGASTSLRETVEYFL